MNTDQSTAEKGYLQVIVSSGDGAFPEENALVFISVDEENGDNGLLFSLRTDISGKTKKVSLDAPPESLSMKPGNNKPFSTYNIQISKEGFGTVENLRVPIFSGITSLQRVNLIPETEFSYLSPGYPDQNREIFQEPERSGL